MDPLTIAALGSLGLTAYNSFKGGSQDEYKQRPRLSKQQIPLLNQAVNAGLQPGAGGAFGDVADYYRGNLSKNPQDFEAYAAPEMRRFNEDIIPGLSEQFAGFGAGGSGLSGSGFRNAAVNAGTDLSERLGQIRANLRQQSAQGLMNVGQVGLGDYTNNTYQQNAPGFLESAAPGIGQAGTAAFIDYLKKPAGISGGQGKYINQVSTKGSSSPYGQIGATGIRPGVGG